MRTIIATAALFLLTVPAAALCTANPGGDGASYPTGSEALLLCQHQELSASMRDRIAAEELRALRPQLQARQFERQRLLARPFTTFDVPTTDGAKPPSGVGLSEAPRSCPAAHLEGGMICA
jgi:hypothetical protein